MGQHGPVIATRTASPHHHSDSGLTPAATLDGAPLIIVFARRESSWLSNFTFSSSLTRFNYSSLSVRLAVADIHPSDLCGDRLRDKTFVAFSYPSDRPTRACLLQIVFVIFYLIQFHLLVSSPISLCSPSLLRNELSVWFHQTWEEEQIEKNGGEDRQKKHGRGIIYISRMIIIWWYRDFVPAHPNPAWLYTLIRDVERRGRGEREKWRRLLLAFSPRLMEYNLLF